MGNCIRHESSMKWAGEDWGCLANDMNGDDHDDQEEIQKTKKKKKTAQEGQWGFEDERAKGFANSCSSTTTIGARPATEVKIKITKKQLEELLGRVELKQMSVEQVLAQLIIASDRYETHQRSWRPALRSIPEVN